ncbi:hypothetical protein [Gordonibacter sp.]|uniref:hypothetical protein n=1 Tax=Gordonibacter sp. TaxID=1968902 RepID=UPI002FC9A646
MQYNQEVDLSCAGSSDALSGGKWARNAGAGIQATAGTSAEAAAVSSLVPSEISKSSSQDVISENELSFEEKLSVLEEAVLRHPLNREILYKALAICSEEVVLADFEERIAACPEFKAATQNPYRLATIIERAYGLERMERDAQGRIVSSDCKEGLDEDEVDDLICSTSFKTTPVGARFVEQHRPQARIIELLELAPDRAEAYCEVLAFAAERPRAYAEIEQLLKGKPALASGSSCSQACSWTSWSARARWFGMGDGG